MKRRNLKINFFFDLYLFCAVWSLWYVTFVKSCEVLLCENKICVYVRF